MSYFRLRGKPVLMTEFDSIRSYWRFAHSVRSERRHVLTAESRNFLAVVARTAGKRAENLPEGTLFWRSQKGAGTTEVSADGGESTVIVDYPFPEDRMKPRPGQALEGRANPKGIPFLYFSSHRDTAAAEARSWTGEVLSVGQFKSTRGLRIVNTTQFSRKRIFVGEPKDPSIREEAVWGDIDWAFAEPTTRSDDRSEYIPTQVLAESFRDSGFDGVAYRSSYGKGHNMVLFDPAAAQQVNCFLVRVRNVQYVFELDEEYSYTIK
jgi:RES domain-containing protein